MSKMPRDRRKKIKGENMQKIMRYSWSLFDQFNRCSKKVFFSKLWGIQEIEREYFRHGTEVHENADRYHKGLPFNNKLIKRYTDVIPKDYFTKTESWIDAKIHNPDNKNDVIAMPFCGKLDGQRDGLIADIKTSKASLSQRVADNMGQITLYLFMEWINTGKILKFEVLNLRKDKNAKGKLFPLQRVITTRTIDDFRELWKQLKIFDNSIQKELFYKERGYECNYCSFKRVCSAESQ